MQWTLYSEWLVVAYLSIHAVFLGVGKETRKALVVVDLFLLAGFLALIVTIPPSPAQSSSTWRFLALWSPVVFFWWAYLWAGKTLCTFYDECTSFDDPLIRWEAKIGQPSLHWAGRGSPLLSEVLHFCYSSYYLYTPVLGIYLHATGRFAEFEAVSFAVLFGYAVAYPCFAVVPVRGPRWGLLDRGEIKPEEQRLPGYLFTWLVLRIMYDGPAHKGGAMPSSHSSTALVFLVWCWRLWGAPSGLAALVLVSGMWIGSIYGRYHYVTDVLAGIAIGVVGVLLADCLIL